MAFKSLNELAPQYLCGLFTNNAQCYARALRNTSTDVRLPKKNSANGQECFHFVEQNYGIAYQLSQNRHPLSIPLKCLSTAKSRGGFCGGGSGCSWFAGWVRATDGGICRRRLLWVGYQWGVGCDRHCIVLPCPKIVICFLFVNTFF